MNYLAHIYLARQSADAQFGALLGDFLKPGQDQHLSLETQLEIRLHRKIDSFTDQHPLNFEARALFADGRRRYAGIVLDVFYDHVLAKHWQQWTSIVFDDFVDDFYRDLLARSQWFPESLQYAAPRMAQQDWIRAYQTIHGIELTIHRMSGRLSRNAHLLSDCLIDLEQHYDQLTSYFFEFFPQLEAYVITERRHLQAAMAANL